MKEFQNMRYSSHTRSRSLLPFMFKRAVGMLSALSLVAVNAHAGALRIEGVHVVPHVQSSEMQYRRKPDFSLGARVEVFLRNESQETLVIPSLVDVRVRGRTPRSCFKPMNGRGMICRRRGGASRYVFHLAQ
jgi:hypothetical protein